MKIIEGEEEMYGLVLTRAELKYIFAAVGLSSDVTVFRFFDDRGIAFSRAEVSGSGGVIYEHLYKLFIKR